MNRHIFENRREYANRYYNEIHKRLVNLNFYEAMRSEHLKEAKALFAESERLAVKYPDDFALKLAVKQWKQQVLELELSDQSEKEWEVWSEGYRESGMEFNQQALFRGRFKGNTFRNACETWIKTLEEKEREYFDKKT